MSRTNHIYKIFVFFALILFSSGCSGHVGMNNGSDITSPPFGIFNSGSFPDIPSAQDSFNIIRTTDSFEIDYSASGYENRISVKAKPSGNIDVIIQDNSICLRNNGTAIYDVRLIIDSRNNENTINDLDFGIIPHGMTTPTIKIAIPIETQSIQAHIEYRDKAFIENEGLKLHSSPFRDKIIPGHNTKAILADALTIGFDNGLDELYPILCEYGLFLTGLIEPFGVYEARFIDGRDPYELVDSLNKDTRIHHAEVEPLLFPSYFPNDPIYDPSQPSEPRWAFERINAVKTWDYYSDHRINETGNASVNGIVFAILDTGLIAHQDLNLDATDINLINYYGKNFVNPGQPVVDTDGHGTAVAGIMGAMGNNAIGMAGMAWNPYFLPIKVFAESKEYGQVGPLFALLQGLMYIRDLAGRAPFFKFIVNMSLGGYEQTPSFWTTEAVNRVCQRPNVILVSGCGNDKNDSVFAGVPFPISADNYYPAALEKVLSVGASSSILVQGFDRDVYQEDSYNWGTNWGTSVDLCAPGSLSIYTLAHSSSTAYNPNFGGTSASCAFVSGLAALAWAKNPSWTRDKLMKSLRDCCDPMWVPSNKTGKLGYGRINAFRIIKGLKPEAFINDVYWTRSGNPVFGDAIHISGEGIFVDDAHTPDSDDLYNFRWFIDGNFVTPAAIGAETMICRLTPGHHTLHFRVWNKGQEWNFADPNQFSELIEWHDGIQIDDSDLPDDYFEMVFIPAGDFTMGCGPMNTGYDDPESNDEKPQHTHYVDSFWIRKYEVTKLEFQNFIEAGGYDDPQYWEPEGWQIKTQNGWQYPLNWMNNGDKGGNPFDFPEFAAHPVNGICWWEADAFCRWASMRLPIEAQWEKAARGTDDPPRNFPWGMDWVVENSNHNADTTTPQSTARVGTYSPQGDSPYGLCDAAGNVWEWCWEWYDNDIYNQYQTGDYTLPTSGESKCCRGGGFIYDGSWVSRCSSRYSTAIPSTTRNGEVGLRPVSTSG